jgi:hypothetical protein
MIRFNIINLESDSLSKMTAILTLSKLSCFYCNHAIMIDEGIIPSLLHFINKNKSKTYRDDNININLIELCRQSAFILANLSTYNGLRILQIVGVYKIILWLDEIECFHDYIVRSWLINVKTKLNILYL